MYICQNKTCHVKEIIPTILNSVYFFRYRQENFIIITAKYIQGLEKMLSLFDILKWTALAFTSSQETMLLTYRCADSRARGRGQLPSKLFWCAS